MQLRTFRFSSALAVLAGLIGAAWLSLFALGGLLHGHAADHDAGHALLPGHNGAQETDHLLEIGLFTAGWALMVVAMMLPTALPRLMKLLSPLGGTSGRFRSLVVLLGGYVAAWMAFGVAVHLVLHVTLELTGLSVKTSAVLGPVALILAGIYQLSPLKRRSLEEACSPATCAAELSASPSPWRGILLLGAREGLTCIGCSWAFMLPMLIGVSFGGGEMLLLGVQMFAEKNAAPGRRLVVPAGLFLIGLGLTLGWGSLLRSLAW